MPLESKLQFAGPTDPWHDESVTPTAPPIEESVRTKGEQLDWVMVVESTPTSRIHVFEDGSQKRNMKV
jgi:hypothetical protein